MFFRIFATLSGAAAVIALAMTDGGQAIGLTSGQGLILALLAVFALVGGPVLPLG